MINGVLKISYEFFLVIMNDDDYVETWQSEVSVSKTHSDVPSLVA